MDWAARVEKYFAELKEKQQTAVDAEAEPERRNSEDIKVNKRNSREGEPARTNADFKGLLKSGPGKKKRRKIRREFHGFIALPLAIRYMIYELLLVKGKVFVPRPEREGCEDYYFECDSNGKIRQRYLDWQNYDDRRIHTALLRGVSKTMHEEAENIFWGPGNQFSFPAGRFAAPAGFSGDDSVNTPYPLPPIKDVSYAFDLRDYGYMPPFHIIGEAKEVLQNWSESLDAWEPVFEDMSQGERVMQLHDMRTSWLSELWERRCELISRLCLKRLQIDFEECYCPDGCCRQVQYVCEMLHGFENGFPTFVEVIGHKDKVEKKLILETLCRMNPGVEKSRITFIEKPAGIS